MCWNQQPKPSLLILLLALLLLSHGASNISCATFPGNSTDVLSLLDFKAANDPNGVLSSWNSSVDHCLWMGVRCSVMHPGRVTALGLAGNKLAGPISPSLGNLTFLRTLDLSSNGLSGELPPLDLLQKLQVLNLSSNSIQGTIPDSLTNCSELTVLDISTNSLVGEIPSRVGLLSNLLVLRFSWNNLTGSIPPTLSNMTHLIKVGLSFNLFTGSIPDGLGQLPNISFVLLGGNSLSGKIPHDLFNSSSIQILHFVQNNLTGLLPFDMGDTLPNIQRFYFALNMFDGQIPDSLGNSSQLDWIDLASNSFTGQVPSTLGKLSKLSVLSLENNKLGATDTQSLEFIHGLRNCTALRVFTLKENQLQGFIPNSVGNLSVNLQQLLLGSNNLSGMVPPSIGNLRSLAKLGLGDNSFSGTIGEWVGQLRNLQFLLLQANNFIGPIPSSISNLTWLGTLSLGKNEFEGTIPPSLGRLQKLSTLDLSYNNLQGSIPLETGKLNQLISISLSANKLTGEIPDTLGQCQFLTSIQMDQNFLTENIPIIFGNLLMLNSLNLSHNNLSGTIPLPLNEIKSLIELDISYNHLEGEIPRNGVFENATALSIQGNWGLCGGAMDLHMPTCPTVSGRSEIEYYLVRALIPIFGFMSLIMLMYTLIFGKKTSQRTYLLLLSFGKKFPVVSYKDIDRATRNFSESTLIGRGSYGSVYVGKLTQAKIQVAIKVFDLDMKCADKSFVTECDVLRSIRHRNLLPILTACSTIDNNGDAFKALVYEYMPNGNLDTWLHTKFCGDRSKCLSLVQRVSIAVGIADALAYLHHDCEKLIVHCDLKPTNILLDNDMNAYLGDFGIASLLEHSSPNASTGLKGTVGYIAPEYAQSGQTSRRGDVYSFGIVLLEMLIGKRPTDPMFENDLNMVTFVERSYPDQILNITDAHLHGEFKSYIQADVKTEDVAYGCLLSLMQVALSCTRLIPRERMNMREVSTKLHAIRTSYIGATRSEKVMLQ